MSSVVNKDAELSPISPDNINKIKKIIKHLETRKPFCLTIEEYSHSLYYNPGSNKDFHIGNLVLFTLKFMKIYNIMNIDKQYNNNLNYDINDDVLMQAKRELREAWFISSHILNDYP